MTSATAPKRVSRTKLSAFVIAFVATEAIAAPPQLYRQPAYQSPVSGEPDDLLMLAGYGFNVDDLVVYRAVQDTRRTLVAPAHVPTSSSAEFGTAAVVSTSNVPYSLTIILPAILRANQTYALWVRTAHLEWSEAVRINDARPLWVTPTFVYSSLMPAFLPREVKVVGRNLQPSRGHRTQIKFTGPQQFTAEAIADPDSASVDRYVARVPLPLHLEPGKYGIQVRRDGVSWVDLNGQALEVVPDPPTQAEFSVSDDRFGGCRPDDGADDTACIARTIAAAKRAGGGVVNFGPGTWDLIDSSQPGSTASEGIVVPSGVQLRGAGSAVTRLLRHAEWNGHSPTAALTLSGHSVVTGFTFQDVQVYQPADQAGPYLKLGLDDRKIVGATSPAGDADAVDSVVITRNVFDKPIVAIGSGGLPISRLLITYNTFGAYRSALDLGGDKYNMNQKFRIDDSIIDYNLFNPGSELDLIRKTGTMASELGAGHRLDFSGNTADGSSTDFLYRPDDARGWRAAYFWNMNNNFEKVLVSQNLATCTADKIGDGEAISFDNNTNTFALASVSEVVQAASTSVAVSAPLATRQFDRDVPLDSYYVGHWIQVASGPGLGQARKIVGYSTDLATHVTTFRVAPAWDVIPQPGHSRISVGREFWQLYAIGNRVDGRKPLCQKGNRSRLAGGQISMWAQSADSVITGNMQYDTDGIFVQQSYNLPEHPCANCTMESFFHSFLEIRSNVIDGEYDWNTDCSASGIAIGAAAAPWYDANPPTVGFGISVSHNTIRHADGQHGGAISQVDSWYAGPEPHRWPLSDNLLVFHNSITDIDGPRALAVCTTSRPRVGIAFPDPGIAWHTVLYGNSCKRVATGLGDGSVEMTAVCPSPEEDSCECAQSARQNNR